MYRERAADMEVNWRSAWEGSTGGAIPLAWNIQYYPSTFVLDHEGRIRHRDLRGEDLDRAVEALLAELTDTPADRGDDAGHVDGE